MNVADRIGLMIEYFELRLQKLALAGEYKGKMKPLCARMNEIEEMLAGTDSQRPTLTLVQED